MASQSESFGPIPTQEIILSGHVQGVGFRPFVLRAHRFDLCGWVKNRSGRVEIIVQGRSEAN